ncbi:MAG: 4-hydroxythreonine-4-phosphate dehydrogenase PdxA [Fibrobacterota bacterium]
MKQHPVIGITMGDPAGIGPEIILRHFQNPEEIPAVYVVIGSAAVLNSYIELLGIPGLRAYTTDEAPTENTNGLIPVIEPAGLEIQDVNPGELRAEYGQAAFRSIETAIDLATAGIIDAVTTAPINKEALKLAGYTYPGHTEIFAEKTGTTNYTMMFRLDQVAVVHVTTHCSLRDALDAITTERVLRNIRLLHRELIMLGCSTPRIAVSGLNPHAGENRMFGHEDAEEILPAVEQARREGMEVSGPHPPDTVFKNAFRGTFDGVVSMLHDHGFVALKSMDFDRGVNITVGLPIIRTSVGHGTAFDIAGTGIASPESLTQALRAAVELACHRRE